MLNNYFSEKIEMKSLIFFIKILFTSDMPYKIHPRRKITMFFNVHPLFF